MAREELCPNCRARINYELTKCPNCNFNLGKNWKPADWDYEINEAKQESANFSCIIIVIFVICFFGCGFLSGFVGKAMGVISIVILLVAIFGYAITNKNQE